jgi:hypothetical protein
MQKALNTLLVETINAISDLSTSKSILNNLIEVLSGQISINDSLVSSKALTKLLSESLSFDTLFSTQKALLKILTETIQPLTTLISNMAVTKYLTETLTGLIQPTAYLSATKSLNMLLTESISILSQITTIINQNVQALIIILSETIGVTEMPQVSLALAFAFLEFIDSITVNDLLQMEKPLSAEEMFIVGAFLAALIVGLLAFALLYTRKNDDD